MQNLHNIPNEEIMPTMDAEWTLGLIAWMAGRPNVEIQAWIYPNEITLRTRSGWKYSRWGEFPSYSIRSWSRYWIESYDTEIDWSRITIMNRKKKKKRA